MLGVGSDGRPEVVDRLSCVWFSEEDEGSKFARAGATGGCRTEGATGG